MAEREEQISRLKERLKALSKKLSETKEASVVRGSVGEQQQAENGVELQSIIRQVIRNFHFTEIRARELKR